MNSSHSNNVPLSNDDRKYTVAAFYKFVRIDNLISLKYSLTELCSKAKILGTILIASEGINGTIAGTPSAIEKLFEWLYQQSSFQGLEVKYSATRALPFHRLKVRLKNEIVTMGQPKVDPNSSVGIYVRPEDWNQLLEDPDIIVIDTRNNYEVEIGSFKNSVNPNTNSFREFPKWVETTLKEMPNADKSSKIAMFCTGGIRCEKASSYLKQQGYSDVYHLEGGILKYLENVPETKSLWRGECFVFDNRISVKQDLLPGSYEMCHACRMPLTKKDLISTQYSPGVSCPKCYGKHTEKQERRFKDRQQQMELAKLRGERHLGAQAKTR